MELVPLDDGVHLATWRVGEVHGDAPPVVLVHGGPGLWDYLRPLADLIGPGNAIYRYDQRGCGRSSLSAEQSMSRSVRDLEELRLHWGAKRLIVIGHSFGAAIAIAYAGTYPNNAAAVAHVGGVGIGDWRTHERAEHARRQTPFAARLLELECIERSWNEEVEWRRLKWASDYADAAGGLEHSRAMAETPLEINYQANRGIRFTDDDLIRWATATTCPVLILHGDADPRPSACATALTEYLATSRVLIIQGAGHLPWVERPNETAAALRDIIAAAS